MNRARWRSAPPGRRAGHRWSLLLLAALVACSCQRFPSGEAVNREMARCASERDAGARRAILSGLLTRLQTPSSSAEDAVAQYGVKRVAEHFARTGDVAVLQALDGLRLDGGFANSVCEVYRELLVKEEARQWYRATGDAPLRRCVGVSFASPEEVRRSLESSRSRSSEE